MITASRHTLQQCPKSTHKSLNSAHISPLVGRWKSNFFFCCQKLLTAKNSCPQLMKMKIYLDSWNLAHMLVIGYRLKFYLFFSNQLSLNINSCLQLSTADDNEYQPRGLKFGICISLEFIWKSKYVLFITSYTGATVVDSWWQQMTADDIEKSMKFDTHINYRV